MTNQALIIFTRVPELGKCKTRLAATVGDQVALEIYKFLIKHTAKITAKSPLDCYVYYYPEVVRNDLWDDSRFNKCIQVGTDLGQKMQHAFQEVFNLGYSQVAIIGSDLFDLNTNDLIQGFEKLQDHDVVIGPAQDGGYYFLGMNKLLLEPFEPMAWGTDSVRATTLERLKNYTVGLLSERNDIDYYHDIKNIPEFEPFIKHLNL